MGYAQYTSPYEYLEKMSPKEDYLLVFMVTKEFVSEGTIFVTGHLPVLRRIRNAGDIFLL